MAYSFQPVFRTVLLLTGIVLTIPFSGFSTGEKDSADSAHHRFQIGYERGISCRYFPVRDWGIGLIASTTTLYNKEYEKYQNTSQPNANLTTTRTGNKNLTLTLEGLRAITLQTPFTLHLFASVGGIYSSYTRTYTHEYTYTNSEYTADGIMEVLHTSREKRSMDETEIGGLGRIGIMPGITWKRFSAALRLGIEGRYTKSRSPDSATEKNNRHSSRVRFLHPSNLVESLVLHFDL